MVSIESRIAAIEERNKRVERDKAWETSWVRKVWILCITYFLTSLTFWLIGVEEYLKNAFIPTVAYLLSTMSLPLARGLWDRSVSNDADS